jgi:hypothetical protein
VVPLVRENGFALKALGKGVNAPTLVYAISDGAGACKVGKCTGSPLVRLATLQTGSARELKLLAYTDDVSERAAHKKLWAAHLRGEWFKTEAVLALVNQWLWLDTDLYGQLRGHLCASS